MPQSTVLSDFFLCRGLSEEEKNSFFAKAASRTAFLPKETIYSAGSDRKALGILLSGRAEVMRKGDSPVLLNRLMPGDVFGVASLFGEDMPFPTEIIAVKRTECLFISEEAVSELLLASPQAAMNYIRFLSEKIRFLNQKVAGFSAKHTEGKLAALLLAKEKDGVLMLNNLSKAATVLSVGRASLYRALDRFTLAGAIKKEGSQITVINKTYLERIKNQ